MASKLLQITSNRPGASTITLIDDEPSTTGYRLMGLDLGTAEYDPVYSGMRGTQGALLADSTAKNRISTFTLQVVGDDMDDLSAKCSVLWSLDEELRRYGGTVRWRSEGATLTMTLRAISSGVAIAGFDRLFELHKRLTISLAIVSPPYMEGDSLDLLDDFSTDTVSPGSNPQNFVRNGSFETDTTGWSTFGTNTITRLTTAGHDGSCSLRANYSNDLRLATVGISASEPNRTIILSAWVWIPSSGWSGGQITISDDGTFGGAGLVVNVNADMSKRDQWQRIYWVATLASDTVGGVFIRAASAPGGGSYILIDGVQAEYANENLLRWNPGFEDAGYGTGFTVNNGPETITRDTVTFHGGVASMKVVTTGVGIGQGAWYSSYYDSSAPGKREIICEPGKTYKMTAWVNAPVGATITCFFYFADIKGPNFTGTQAAPVLLSGNGAWQQVVVTGTAPADGNRIIPYFINNNATAVTYYVDDIIVEEAALPTPSDFPVDDVGSYEWTWDAGSKEDVLVGDASAFATDRLIPIRNGSLEKRMIRTGRGYRYTDVQLTLRHFQFGSNGYKAGHVLKRLSADTYLEAYYTVDANPNGSLKIDKVVNGARTNLASVGVTTTLAGETWLRARMEGNQITLEGFQGVNAPTPMGATTASLTYSLTLAEQAIFGDAISGFVGITWTPINTVPLGTAANNIDSWEIEAYVYRNVQTPQVLRLVGIPGDAPALADAEITASGGAGVPIWAMLAWWAKPQPYNLCWNGDFEDASVPATAGWWISSLTLNNVPTSVARSTAFPKYGLGALEVVSPAVSFTGPEFTMFRRFRKGVTYTATMWVRAAAPTGTGHMILGVAADNVASNLITFNSTWQLLTVSWTPTADVDKAVLAPRHNEGVALTWQIDAVTIYEGTPPESPNHLEGRGGWPAGLIDAENSLIAQASLVTDGTLKNSTGTDAGGFAVVVDPALMVPDDYTESDIALEVWARIKYTGTPLPIKLNAVAIGGGTSLPTVYSEEYGSVGKTPINYGPGTSVSKLIRCGTLRLPTNAGRYAIKLQTGASATPLVDYIIIVPAANRAALPTGKADDGVTYPYFARSTAEQTRTFRSDLSGRIQLTSSAEAQAPGMGGALLELPTGVDLETLFKVSTVVPDEPTVANVVNDQLVHAATIHYSITPRWRLGR